MNERESYTLIRRIQEHPWLQFWTIAVLHGVFAYVGVAYIRVHDELSLIWPASGLALAAVLYFGLRVWPALAASTLITSIALGMPVGAAVWLMISSTLQPLLVGSILRVYCRCDAALLRLRDVLWLALVGVGLGTLLSMALGAPALLVFNVSPWETDRLLKIWWLNEAMGLVLVTPTILVWLHKTDERYSGKRVMEAAILLLLLIVVSHVVYGGILEDRLSKPLAFVCFPFVIWGALRFGQRGATATTLVAVAIAIVNMGRREGPFIQPGPILSLVYLVGFSAATMVTGLLLGAVVSEYRALARQLQQAGELLEARVANRTAELEEELQERERVSAALRASEERFKRISQTITDYIYTVAFVDGHPVSTTHAPTSEQVTGYTAEELTANPFLWLHMVHSDDRDRVLQLTPQIMATHKPVTIEHRIIRKDGVMRWVQNTTSPKFNAEGTVVSYDGLIKDITDRKIAEEALRESESKLRAVFESAGVGIAITSLDGNILECNPALSRMLGYGPGELLGQSLRRIAHPDDHAVHKGNARRILTGSGDGVCRMDSRYIRKDGSTMWGHLTSALLRDAHGSPQYALSVVEDITSRKLAELEREKLLRTVQEAMANVRTLSGLVPICSTCKKIRDDRGEWTAVEEYLTQHTGARFSHGICPECLKKYYPEYAESFSVAAGVQHGSDGHLSAGDERGSTER